MACACMRKCVCAREVFFLRLKVTRGMCKPCVCLSQRTAFAVDQLHVSQNVHHINFLRLPALRPSSEGNSNYNTSQHAILNAKYQQKASAKPVLDGAGETIITLTPPSPSHLPCIEVRTECLSKIPSAHHASFSSPVLMRRMRSSRRARSAAISRPSAAFPSGDTK